MNRSPQHLNIGAVVFPAVDQADLTGPFEVLSRIPDASFQLLAKQLGSVRDVNTPGRERAMWVSNLEKIAARNPAIVVPGHMTAGAAADISGIEHTKAYLLAFEEELAKAKDSAALIAAMNNRFPALAMDVALNIGAKVATGEMKWS